MVDLVKTAEQINEGQRLATEWEPKTWKVSSDKN